MGSSKRESRRLGRNVEDAELVVETTPTVNSKEERKVKKKEKKRSSSKGAGTRRSPTVKSKKTNSETKRSSSKPREERKSRRERASRTPPPPPKEERVAETSEADSQTPTRRSRRRSSSAVRSRSSLPSQPKARDRSTTRRSRDRSTTPRSRDRSATPETQKSESSRRRRSSKSGRQRRSSIASASVSNGTLTNSPGSVSQGSTKKYKKRSNRSVFDKKSSERSCSSLSPGVLRRNRSSKSINKSPNSIQSSARSIQLVLSGEAKKNLLVQQPVRRRGSIASRPPDILEVPGPPVVYVRKNVAFAAKDQVLKTISLSDYSPKEYQLSWFTNKEMEKTMERCQTIIENNLLKAETTGRTHCVRGLEKWTPMGLEKIRLLRSAHYLAVLSEQEEQKKRHAIGDGDEDVPLAEEMPSPEEAICKRSRAVTRNSVQNARKRAQQDKKAIKRYLVKEPTLPFSVKSASSTTLLQPCLKPQPKSRQRSSSISSRSSRRRRSTSHATSASNLNEILSLSTSNPEMAGWDHLIAKFNSSTSTGGGSKSSGSIAEAFADSNTNTNLDDDEEGIEIFDEYSLDEELLIPKTSDSGTANCSGSTHCLLGDSWRSSIATSVCTEREWKSSHKRRD